MVRSATQFPPATQFRPATLTPAVSAVEFRWAMERVLQSAIFRRAQRSRRFLGYLVESATAAPPITVKEYTIALDVFDRDASYDPAVDATVRVEASRLRARLREYYAEEGHEDPWMLQVPKGSYAAVLSRRGEAYPKPMPLPAANAPGLVVSRLSEAEPGFISLVAIAEMVGVLDRIYGFGGQQIAAAVEGLLQAQELVVQSEHAVFTAMLALRTGRVSFTDAQIGALEAEEGRRVTATLDRKAARMDPSELV